MIVSINALTTRRLFQTLDAKKIKPRRIVRDTKIVR